MIKRLIQFGSLKIEDKKIKIKFSIELLFITRVGSKLMPYILQLNGASQLGCHEKLQLVSK